MFQSLRTYFITATPDVAEILFSYKYSKKNNIYNKNIKICIFTKIFIFTNTSWLRNEILKLKSKVE